MGGAATGEYCLGTSSHELERLALQHEVWSGPTARFLDALRIPLGGRALDAGAGPGHAALMLSRRVGPAGEVVALDAAEGWAERLRERAREERWPNVRVVQARIEEADLPEESFDVVFLRWVLAFLPEPEAVVRRLASWVRPGGALAIVDYDHDGIGVFPPSEGFRAAVRATREWYARHGGDAWIMGRVPRMLRAAGLDPSVLEPWVLAGPPGSPCHRWMDAFFPFHSDAMVREGLLSEDDRARFLREWAERGHDPSALFVSPIVVACAARKPENASP